jgi:DNA (cytosine-5)-methyltransferase 1
MRAIIFGLEIFGMKNEPIEGRHRKPTFIDLFGGCGGISLGLMEAGWKGLFAIEKEGKAFETLKHNLTGKKGKNYFNWPEWLDKKPYEISEFNKQHEKDLLRLRGKVDLVSGGPPCQGFSLAGKRDKRDPRNQLFKEYIKFLRIVQPVSRQMNVDQSCKFLRDTYLPEWVFL